MRSLQVISPGKKIFVGLMLVLLASCSSTMRGYKDTLEYAFFPGDGVDLTLEDIVSRPVPSLYVKVADRPRSLLVLQSSLAQQQKWLSYDRAIVVLEGGRLVKASGFDNDLIYSRFQQPLSWQTMSGLAAGAQYQSLHDYQRAGTQGLIHRYQLLETKQQTLTLFQRPFSATVFYEQVTFADGSVAVNEFWFDNHSKTLLKSKQHPAQFWPVMEFVHISDAASLLVKSPEQLP